MAWELKGNDGTDPNADFLGTINSQPLVIRTASSEAMRISADGNVNVGPYVGPSVRLQVTEGHLRIVGTSDTFDQTLSLYNNVGKSLSLTVGANGGGTAWYTQANTGTLGVDVGMDLRFSAGAAEAMRIRADGSIGIGTTTPNPSYNLHVKSVKSHGAGILAESDTGTGLTALSHTPNFFALSAVNDQGSAFVAVGSETEQSGTGVTARGFTAVRGESQNGTGVLGITHSQQSPSVSGVGVYGQSFGNPGAGVIAYSEYGSGLIAFGCTQGGSGAGIYAGTTFGWCGQFISGDVRSKGGVFISVPAGQPGLQVASGTKSAIVPTSQGSRSLYSEEATEVWFTDYGFGHLEDGHTVITIDPLFAEAVNLSELYHVFAQLNDTSAEGVAIVNKTESGFEVVELRNGRSNAAFSYRLVAKRRGHEQDRLQRAPWADDDPNLYPEKRDIWEAQQRILFSRPDVS